MKEQLKILKKHILTGTSHMIPFIVAGGILFSLAVMLNPAGAATPETGWLAGLAQIGLGGLTLFVPVLGGYIAYSIADKPGLAPGMIGAYLAKEMGAGFLGGMAAGLIAGVVVKELKRIKLPISLKTLGSIFIYPLYCTRKYPPDQLLPPVICGIVKLARIGSRLKRRKLAPDPDHFTDPESILFRLLQTVCCPAVSLLRRILLF